MQQSPTRKKHVGGLSFTEAMPENAKLSVMLKGKHFNQKQQLLNEVAQNSRRMEGILSVNEMNGRYEHKRANTINKVN